MTKNCLIYCRTSGDDSERDSLGSQEQDCLEYAQKQGYHVLEVLKEDIRGVSGADFHAPMLQRAINLSYKEVYNVLVIRDVTRFARERHKANFVEFELMQNGVNIEYAWQKFTNDSDGDFVKGIHYLLAQKERTDITKRLARGRKHRIAQGSFIVHGSPPFGYDAVRNSAGLFDAVIIEQEAEIVRLIFKWYVEDDLSIYQIAQRLNENKIPTYAQLRHGETDTRWYRTRVSALLRLKVYSGKYVYGKTDKQIVTTQTGERKERVTRNEPDKFIEVDVPPIVSMETWQAAQAKLNKNVKGRKAKHEYLMSRKIQCFCGYSMSGSTGSNNLYYACRGNNSAKRVCKTRVRADLVDNIAWQWFCNLFDEKEFNGRLESYVKSCYNEVTDLEGQLQTVESYLVQLEQRYKKLVNSIMNSDEYGEEKLTPFKLEIELDMREYEAKRDALKDDIQGVLYEMHIFNMATDSNLDDRTYEFNLKQIESIREYIRQPLTFEEKEKLLTRYNVRALILNREQIKLTCNLGDDVCKLNYGILT